MMDRLLARGRATRQAALRYRGHPKTMFQPIRYLPAIALVVGCSTQPVTTPAPTTAPPATPDPAAAQVAADESALIGQAEPSHNEARGFPKPGWSKLVLEDEVPVCIFSSHDTRAQAPFADQAKQPQKLRAGSSLVFGAFGAGCLNEACDDLPTLQCGVTRTGQQLTVHARYNGYHRDGMTCSEGCREVTAGCETPQLEAGRYQVQYGDRRFALRIPSTLPSACVAWASGAQ